MARNPVEPSGGVKAISAKTFEIMAKNTLNETIWEISRALMAAYGSARLYENRNDVNRIIRIPRPPTASNVCLECVAHPIQPPPRTIKTIIDDWTKAHNTTIVTTLLRLLMSFLPETSGR